MPTYSNTARYLLRKLTGSNLISDIDAGIAALADDIDGKMVGYSAGAGLGSRPTSTGGTPGIPGRRYRDTTSGILYEDTGTSWVEVYTPPLRVLLTRGTSKTITTSTVTIVDFSATSYDTGLADLATNSVLIPRAGLYLIHAGGVWAAAGSPAGERKLSLRELVLDGGGGVIGSSDLTPPSDSWVSGPAVASKALAQKITVPYYASSSGKRIGVQVEHQQGSSLGFSSAFLAAELVQL